MHTKANNKTHVQLVQIVQLVQRVLLVELVQTVEPEDSSDSDVDIYIWYYTKEPVKQPEEQPAENSEEKTDRRTYRIPKLITMVAHNKHYLNCNRWERTCCNEEIVIQYTMHNPLKRAKQISLDAVH